MRCSINFFGYRLQEKKPMKSKKDTKVAWDLEESNDGALDLPDMKKSLKLEPTETSWNPMVEEESDTHIMNVSVNLTKEKV
jgi:hypothetical protein